MAIRTFKLTPLLLVLVFLWCAAALAVNRTIDDEYGDSSTGALPLYNPRNRFSQGNSCRGCWAKPDPAQIFNQTWHDASIFGDDSLAELTITMSFNGMAVYVYCILDNNNSDQHTNLMFSIDGTTVGTFSHIHDGSGIFVYNALVYGNASIPDGNHTFVIHVLRSTGSLVLFDYMNYIHNVESTDPTTPGSTAPTTPGSTIPTTPRHSNVGFIAGAAVGAVVLLLIVVVNIFVWRRRQAPNTLSTHPIPLTKTVDGISSNFTSPRFSKARPVRLQHEHPLPPGRNPKRDTAPPPSRADLLLQLQDHENRLNALRNPPYSPPSTSQTGAGPSAIRTSVLESQVKELQQEVTRLRVMMGGYEAPPGYHD